MADNFKLVIYCTLSLTVTCGVLLGAIAIWGPNPQPAPIATLFEALKSGFLMGMFSVFGLLGMRSAGPPSR